MTKSVRVRRAGSSVPDRQARGDGARDEWESELRRCAFTDVH